MNDWIIQHASFGSGMRFYCINGKGVIKGYYRSQEAAAKAWRKLMAV